VKKFMAISLGVLLVLALSVGGCAQQQVPPVLTIGAVYVGAINDHGYNQALHEGIEAIADNIANVTIIEAENVPAGTITTSVQSMINQGAKLIFATSYDYYNETLALSVAHPDVAFEWCGGGENATANLGVFFGQPPDGWYLMGMAAALMMQHDNITDPKFGFVAAFPRTWTRTFINAFTLGAQSVYPPIVRNETSNTTSPSPVTVQVAYTYDWASVALQIAATNALIDGGAKVITMHVDAPGTIIAAAESRDVYSIGYQSTSAYIYAPNYWISGLGFTFGALLTPIAQSVIDGNFTGQVNMWSWAQGAMALAPWGPLVPQSVKDAVLAAKAELIAGNRTVFIGPIYDTTGNIACCHPGWDYCLYENVTIPDWMMGWADDFYVWGVEGGE
jgi:basic membrane protein A